MKRIENELNLFIDVNANIGRLFDLFEEGGGRGFFQEGGFR